MILHCVKKKQKQVIMVSERVNLSWDEFQAFKSGTLTGLYLDKDFVDVTLACEDGQQIKAHKVVLSSCSSFFKNILLKYPHPSPLIYLKGVKHTDLQAILKFIYIGQTEVDQEEVASFLDIAKELEIKGLAEESTTKKQDHLNICNEIKEENPFDLFEFEHDANEKLDTNEEDALLGMEVNNEKQKDKDGKYGCDDCDYKTSHRRHMNTHKLSIHAKVKF